jgi:hypothetical protein
MNEFERDFTTLEDQLGGIPKKRWLRPFSSPLSFICTQWEREWDSLSHMEEAGERMMASEEHKKLRDSLVSSGVITSFQRELLTIENPFEAG